MNADSKYVSKDTMELLISQWDRQSCGKIGKFAFAALSYIVSKCLLTKEEFAELCTAEAVKLRLGFPLTHSPLFGLKEIVDSNGYRRSWREPVIVTGKSVYMNQQWYEANRNQFLAWLRPILRRNDSCLDMLDLVLNDNLMGEVNIENSNVVDEDDTYSAALDAWGEDALK
jgi:hypothetical protein